MEWHLGEVHRMVFGGCTSNSIWRRCMEWHLGEVHGMECGGCTSNSIWGRCIEWHLAEVFLEKVIVYVSQQMKDI